MTSLFCALQKVYVLKYSCVQWNQKNWFPDNDRLQGTRSAHDSLSWNDWKTVENEWLEEWSALFPPYVLKTWRRYPSHVTWPTVWFSFILRGQQFRLIHKSHQTREIEKILSDPKSKKQLRSNSIRNSEENFFSSQEHRVIMTMFRTILSTCAKSKYVKYTLKWSSCVKVLTKKSFFFNHELICPWKKNKRSRRMIRWRKSLHQIEYGWRVSIRYHGTRPYVVHHQRIA